MELETATLDEIGDELRKRCNCFVLACMNDHKVSDNHTVFNSDWGGNSSSVFTAIGLCNALARRLMLDFEAQKREE